MRAMNKVIMTLAGLLLIVGTLLKCEQMLSTCVPSWKVNTLGFWESYEFFLIQIPLELALGVWMVCGLFRKGAWFFGTLAYFGFIFVTLTKVITGAESCGCFGQIHVDPLITLFAIDIPFFLLLAIFRPKGTKLLPPPWPNVGYLIAVAIPTMAFVVLSGPLLVTFRPECITADDTQVDEAAQLRLQIHKLKQELQKQKEVNENLKQGLQDQEQPLELQEALAKLESLKQQFSQLQEGTHAPLIEAKPVEEETPTTVVLEEVVEETPPPQEAPAAAQWEWLEYVVEDDVRQQLTEGLVVVMMHRSDCDVCEEMAPRYSEYYQQLVDQEAAEFKIAFLALPPHGEEDHVPDDTACIEGRLTDEKDWGLMSPYVVGLLDGELVKTWEPGTAPEPENILDEVFGE